MPNSDWYQLKLRGTSLTPMIVHVRFMGPGELAFCVVAGTEADGCCRTEFEGATSRCSNHVAVVRSRENLAALGLRASDTPPTSIHGAQTSWRASTPIKSTGSDSKICATDS